jgi:tRNA (guanine-N7-)-methyltransferase
MTDGAAPAARRPVRSYVLRQGRMSDAQKRALRTLRERYVIEYNGQPLDLAHAFGRRAPTILEIGFGMGETTAAIAQAHAEIDYLAIEVHSPGVGALLKRLAAQELTNVRIVQHDAVEVVEHMLAPDSIDGAHVFFPDPWPKKRHHKRRLIQAPFVHLLAQRVRPGGYLHVATDWEPYAAQMLEVLSGEPLLLNTAPGFAPRPAHRPLTKFEQRGLTLGHPAFDLLFRRR